MPNRNRHNSRRHPAHPSFLTNTDIDFLPIAPELLDYIDEVVRDLHLIDPPDVQLTKIVDPDTLAKWRLGALETLIWNGINLHRTNEGTAEVYRQMSGYSKMPLQEIDVEPWQPSMKRRA